MSTTINISDTYYCLSVETKWEAKSKPERKGNTLMFKNVGLGDSQVIQCNASNTHGSIWQDVYLYVKGERMAVIMLFNKKIVFAPSLKTLSKTFP